MARGRSPYRLKSCLKQQQQQQQHHDDEASVPNRKTNFQYSFKKVIFDEIMIKEYPCVIGDNPAVSEGKQRMCWRE